MTTGSGSLRLNLGCGPVVVEGWENLDKSPNVLLSKLPFVRGLLKRLGLITAGQAEGFPPGVKFADLVKRLPYADASVEYIYSGHLVEHISPSQAAQLLAECHRVLAPGGVIRFSTPDLREFVDEYLENSGAGGDHAVTAADEFMRQMGTFVDIDGSRLRRFVNRNISAFHHQWLYDEASLKRLFEQAGFVAPESKTFRDDSFPDLATLEVRPGGLFIQATA